MKKRTLILALTAILLVCTAPAGTAFAYFTTYARATGGYVIELGDQTTIDDDVSNWVKHVKITVSDDSQPVFVRARAFGPTDYELQYSGSEKWAPGGDGYYYYQEACTAGQQLDELNIRIANVPEQKDIVKPEEFNVVVVHETTPARYNADGSLRNSPEDWANAKVDRGTEEGGMENE